MFGGINLSSEHLSEEQLSLFKPVPDDDYFDPESLEQGIQIELEHTTSKEVAKIIAKAHLVEDPNYYVKLLKFVEVNE